MAKFSITLTDGDGVPLPAQAVQILTSGTSTVKASTNASDTGGVLTITDNGDGSYTTAGTYGVHLASGHLDTGTYDVKVGGVLQAELTAISHIDPADIGGALQSSENLGDLDDTAIARVNLGVEIGVDVLAYSANAVAAAAWYGLFAAVAATYPFPYWSGGSPAFLGPSGMRAALGMGDIYSYDADQFVGAIVSGSAPPTASNVYVGRFWIRNSSTEFSMYVCVRTGESTYAWRLLQCANSGGTDREDIFYTYGGA